MSDQTEFYSNQSEIDFSDREGWEKSELWYILDALKMFIQVFRNLQGYYRFVWLDIVIID